MKLQNCEKFAFITLGLAALNAALMSQGIETMPNMWDKAVYQDATLGASLGSVTGIAIGGTVGAAYIATQETVKASISAIRNKFNKDEPGNALKL